MKLPTLHDLYIWLAPSTLKFSLERTVYTSILRQTIKLPTLQDLYIFGWRHLHLKFYFITSRENHLCFNFKMWNYPHCTIYIFGVIYTSNFVDCTCRLQDNQWYHHLHYVTPVFTWSGLLENERHLYFSIFYSSYLLKC